MVVHMVGRLTLLSVRLSRPASIASVVPRPFGHNLLAQPLVRSDDLSRSKLAAVRLRVLLSGVVVLVVALTSCGSRDLQYTPAIGVSALGDNMDALSLTVVTNGKGTATVVGALLNHHRQPDRLMGVEAWSPSTRRSVAADLPQGSVVLPTELSVKLAERHAIRLTDPSFELGRSLDLTLSFEHADDVALTVLIFPQTRAFEHVPVGPASTINAPF